MLLELRLAQFGAPSAVVRSLAVCALAALALALGCGGGGGSAPILDKSESVTLISVSTLLESSEIPASLNNSGFWSLDDPEDWKDSLRDGIESLTSGFISADSISTLAFVEGNAYYSSVTGDLDFADIRNGLEDDGREEVGYRGFEVWQGSSDGNLSAILEDRNLTVWGNDESVKDVIKAFDRGDGFADETDPLKRVLDKAGDGLFVFAFTDCNEAIVPISSSSCRAVAASVTGGDAGKTEMFVVYLFSSERRAESSRDDIEDSLYDIPSIDDTDLGEISADGEFVTFRATIYE